MFSGKPGKLISTLNIAPLHAALASKPATPTSETAFPLPLAANSGNNSNNCKAKFAVSNGFSVAISVALRIASLRDIFSSSVSFGSRNDAITSSNASLSSSANSPERAMVFTARIIAFSAMSQPADHFSFPIVKSQTIMVRAEA